jgi:hypothetical protein
MLSNNLGKTICKTLPPNLSLDTKGDSLLSSGGLCSSHYAFDISRDPNQSLFLLP